MRLRWQLRKTVCVCAALLALGGCSSTDESLPAPETAESQATVVETTSTDPPESDQPEPTSAPSTSQSTTEPRPTQKIGDVAICNNGDYSNNADFSATCSSADGVRKWLARYALCDDGTVVRPEDERPCDGGKSGFVRLLDDSEPWVLALDDMGLVVMNRLGCSSVDGPFTLAGVAVSYACTSSSGGVAFVAGDANLDRLDLAKLIISDPSYDALASTIVAVEDSDFVVFAVNDFAFWGNEGPDFDEFDAIDTDCLNPGLDDPALCGPAPGAVPDLLCVRLDLAEEALAGLDLPEPVTVDATGEDRNVFLPENWVVVDQLPAPFEVVSGGVTLAVVKTSDGASPCG